MRNAKWRNDEMTKYIHMHAYTCLYRVRNDEMGKYIHIHVHAWRNTYIYTCMHRRWPIWRQSINIWTWASNLTNAISPCIAFCYAKRSACRNVSLVKIIYNQTCRFKAESQQIAVWKLLYWIQHLNQYSSRMQEILRPDEEPELSGHDNLSRFPR